MTPYPYELATPEQRAIGSPWWCVHHAVRLEHLTEPVENRAAYLRSLKPSHEVETRLRALRPVVGQLPPALVKAYADRQKAVADWRKAYADWREAHADHAAEIDALFAAECADVPWGPGGLVFPQAEPTQEDR